MLPRQLQPPRPDGSLGRAQTRLFFWGRTATRKAPSNPPTRRQPLLPSPSPTHQRHQQKVNKSSKSIISSSTELPTTINNCNSSTCDKNYVHPLLLHTHRAILIIRQDPLSFLLDPAQKSLSLISSLLTAQNFHRDPIDLFFFFAHTSLQV